MNNLEKARENFLNKEKNLSKYACLSKEAIRLKEDDEDIRTSYFRDIDRIIHANSYTRYIDKTQVFTNSKNDHISKRITHVQFVSKVARTIGRSLNLNEDLIEAIALGHDIGHTPLGHFGESILNEISKKELNEYFSHNIQSVRYYMEVEKDGKGLNLTIQVLDGIMTHNGEMLESTYYPEEKTKEDFLKQYKDSYKDIKKSNKNHPMTLEGCVVRISDIIAYIGRDIEDAIRLNKIDREIIPNEIIEILGDNNKDIVNTIILDIIENSMDKPYIKLSDDVFKALFMLKKFNYENIYNKSISDKNKIKYKEGMNKIYYRYLSDLENNNTKSVIYKDFLHDQSEEYKKNNSNKRIVIDFIAGMTDDFFLDEIAKS